MVGLGLLLALAVAEGGLRALVALGPRLAAGGPAGAELFSAPRLPLRYDREAIEQIAAGQAYVAFDAELGWITTPNADRLGADIHYRHNAAGLRAERDYPAAPRAGTRRYAAYGDSFTYCEEVELDDCWTRRLEEALPRSEVLNFGVPGYAPDQAWLRYRRDGAAAHPCAVLIGTMVENINRMVNRFRPFYYPETGIPLAKPRFVLAGGQPELLATGAGSPERLGDPAWVEANLGPRDAWYFPGTFVANPLDALQVVSLVRTSRYRWGRDEGVEWQPGWAERVYRPGGEAFEVLVAVLSGFAEQVRADGATPVVLVFPWKGEILAARDGGARPHAALVEALRQRGVATIDLTDALGEQARRSSIGNLTVEHYRPLGNQVVARAVARQLPGLAAESCGR